MKGKMKMRSEIYSRLRSSPDAYKSEMKYGIYEKKNKFALHMICDTKKRAEFHLANTIPEYVKKSYYSDKTLTVDSFEVREYKS